MVFADVIILKTWVPLEMVTHCFPVRTLLLPPSEKAAWQGMKTLAQVKKNRGIKNLANPDSLYSVSKLFIISIKMNGY